MSVEFLWKVCTLTTTHTHATAHAEVAAHASTSGMASRGKVLMKAAGAPPVRAAAARR